jgi:hypothetical protein
VFIACAADVSTALPLSLLLERGNLIPENSNNVSFVPQQLFFDSRNSITSQLNNASKSVETSYLTSLSNSSIFILAAKNEITSIDSGLSIVRNALNKIYELESTEQSQAAARQAIQFIESNLRLGNLQACNQLLNEINENKLSSRSLIGLIRSTFRVKDMLPAWRFAYEKAWNAIARLGKNPEALFLGMSKPRELAIATESM